MHAFCRAVSPAISPRLVHTIYCALRVFFYCTAHHRHLHSFPTRRSSDLYEEEGQRFAVSQVEELGFGNFWQHANPISAALLSLREDEGLAFAALLVTDINTQNSLLLVKGDASFIQRISYAHVEQDEIFDLPGIVSRKKQLIPYLTSLLKEMNADGNAPKPRIKPATAQRK